MADETNGTEHDLQGSEEQAQGRLQGAMPLIASVAAAAAAAGVAIVARKALSGERAGRAGGGDDEEKEEERDPTSFDDLDQVADDLSALVDELRSAAAAEDERDFDHLVEIADAISEYADQAATAFDATASGSDDDEESSGRVTDDLMSRVQGLTADVREQVGVGSSPGDNDS